MLQDDVGSLSSFIEQKTLCLAGYTLIHVVSDLRSKMAVDGIPVVDFSAMSLENKSPLSDDDPTIRDLADQVYQAFSTIGFVYLRNHGIPQEMVGAELQLKLAPLSVKF